MVAAERREGRIVAVDNETEGVVEDEEGGRERYWTREEWADRLGNSQNGRVIMNCSNCTWLYTLSWVTGIWYARYLARVKHFVR